VRDGSRLSDGLGLGDLVGVGVGFPVGLALGHGSHVGRTVGVGGASVGVGSGAADVAVAVGDASSPGNFGSPNRYLSGSSLSAAVACSMNCRQIGPGPVLP
jgi:hypothetical protein